MADPVLGAGVETVGGLFKDLVVDRIVEYVKFFNSYEENMGELRKELQDLCDKKLDLEDRVMKGKQSLQVMTRQTATWLEVVIDMIKGGEIRELMKNKGVAEIVVKMMDRRVLKNLWIEDREVFDIVVGVVKNKCSHQQAAAATDKEVVDADYEKVAKIAIDVMKDAADEFTKFIKTDYAAAALVKLLSDEDLAKLAKDGDDMALILKKAEGINRKKIEHNDDEESLLLRKQSEDVQEPFKRNNIVKDKVLSLRKRMGSLMTFLEDEKFKKGLPNAALLGLEVMGALSKSSGSEQQAEQNGKPHRYCGWNVIRFDVYRHRHDMSLMSVAMVTEIKSMISKYPSDPVTRDRTDDDLEFIPGEFVQGLESRDALLRKILTALNDDKVNVVGVYGMGGCGKTTLAKEVANKRAGDLFNKRIVVEVSEAPNIKSIQDQIAGGIELIWKDTQQSVAQRARVLYNTLKSEKILIILDNVWKKLKLDEVGIPHRENNKDFFCKLLITTRDREVCSRDMDVEGAHIFEVGLLNEGEALKLFEKQIEKKVESEEEFKLVANRLLGKCGGLPLAIATTASALKGKNLAMWNHFAEISEKPISSQVSSEYRETYSILETSYKLMNIEEKRMFLFLACLSPLDSAVSVEDLMRYGIGLNLFQRLNSLSDAMEQATNWANELISSSLLLKGDSDGEVKIHDLVRASTISFIDKGKDRITLVESIPRWMCEETFEKFTAISLMSGHDFSQLSGVIAPKLEILLLKGDISSTTLPPNFFVGMKNLKVLSLSNVDFNSGLPESMGLLERLKTLHLHYCKLRDVKLIGKLANLLVLSLRGSSLKELAIEIGELCKLRLLDLGGCKGLDIIPANILSRFSQLEGFYMLNSFDGWASTTNNNNIQEVDGEGSNQQQAIISGRELDKLTHLNVLEMEVSKAEQLLTVNTDQFVQQLSKFRVRVCNDSELCMVDDVSMFRYVLELAEIDPSQSVWLKALLKKTQCLLVRDCGSLVENLVPLFEGGGFNDLRYLHVEKCEFIKCIVSNGSNEWDDESMTTTFVKLELLAVKEMNSLEVICDGKVPTGMFSNLRQLSFWSLPQLKYGLLLTFASLELITEISIVSCHSLEFIVSMEDASVTENETYIDLFPHLRSLVLIRVGSLSSVLRQSRNDQMSTIENDEVADDALFSTESKYPCLEYLELTSIYVIVTLWSKTCYVSSFEGLKVLSVERCDKLRGLGSPRIFAALVQLEELKIIICWELEEVISKEMEEDEVPEHVIKFPSLKRLILSRMHKFRRFYGGSYRLEFPNLKSLTLSDVEGMTNFDGAGNSTTFFSDKIKFPSLEELEVRSVSNEVVRLWNWSSSSDEGDSSNSLNPVPNLKQFRVGEVNDGLTSIPRFISHKLSHLEVKDFHNIKTLFSSIVVPPLNRDAFWTYSQFPTLEDLSVDYCDSLEQLFENGDDEDALMLCKSLTGIKLVRLRALKIFPLQLFANIRTLFLNILGWKYVFSGDLFIKGKEQLQLLESLDICCFYCLEVIIMDEAIEDEEGRVYCFPRLKFLNLSEVSITKFASKPNIGLHFPSLERIELKWCRGIQSFCSGPLTAPKLKVVELQGCDSLEYVLSKEVNEEVEELPSLETLDILNCSSLLSFSCEPLVTPKLQSVKCDECPKMKWVIQGDPNKGDILEFPCLESVKINECWDLQSFSSGKTKAPKLCELEVDSFDYSKRSNDDLQHLLDTFKDIIIRRAEENDEELEELQSDDNDESEEEQSRDSDEELEELQSGDNDESEEE